MPGVRALIDRYRPTDAIAARRHVHRLLQLGPWRHTYFLAGWLAAAFGWRAALPSPPPPPSSPRRLRQPAPPPTAAPDAPRRLFDPRPVVANTAALGFILARRGALLGLVPGRASWMVAFLVLGAGAGRRRRLASGNRRCSSERTGRHGGEFRGQRDVAALRRPAGDRVRDGGFGAGRREHRLRRTATATWFWSVLALGYAA